MKSTQTPTPTTLELASDVQRLIDGFASRVDGSTERLNGVLVGAALHVANCAAFDAFATLRAVRDCGDQTNIRTAEAAAMTALTPHDAMVAWGAAVTVAWAAWGPFHAADVAHIAAQREYRRPTHPRTGAEEQRLFKAMTAASMADKTTYAVYDDASDVAILARGAACDAYDHAGFPQAFQVLEAVAPHWKDWTPDLEDVVAALLADPTHT